MGEGRDHQRWERTVRSFSRFVVSLMWGLLLAVILVVAYLFSQFYGASG